MLVLVVFVNLNLRMNFPKAKMFIDTGEKLIWSDTGDIHCRFSFANLISLNFLFLLYS